MRIWDSSGCTIQQWIMLMECDKYLPTFIDVLPSPALKEAFAYVGGAVNTCQEQGGDHISTL